MLTYSESSVEDCQAAYKTVRETFLAGTTRPIAWRKHQLKQLGFLVQDNEPAFVAALAADLSRPEFETVVAELNPLKGEINEAYDHLDKWAKPDKVKTSLVWGLAKATVYSEPKGVALVIGTWNYPITLLLTPLLGAISAGCTAVIKPAEQCPATAALMASLVPKYLDTSAYKVITGAIPQTTALLALRYDHIFYTGSGGVGRIIAKAAAEHLTPVTLELGGKSPAVVFDDAHVEKTGRRIMWGKYVNSGQICISPDYVVCTREMQPKLIASFKAALAEFNPPAPGATTATPLVSNPGFSKIINPLHFDRVAKLIEGTKGKVVIGGTKSVESGKIEVTVVSDVLVDDVLMQGEIFGPVLPIMVMETKEEIVEFINARDNPLALYVFTQKTANRDYIFSRTRSGTFVQNDVLVQFAIPGLPFGGAGPSGYGNYHGKKSFDTFSHERASASVPMYMDALLAARYPPYTPAKLKTLLMATKAVIKKPSTLGGLSKILRVFAILAAIVAGYKRFAA